MQMNVVAPCPKKPSSTSRSYHNHWLSSLEKDCIDMQDVEDACLELQQILTSQNNTSSTSFNNNTRYQQPTYYNHDHFITRTGNPLIQDSSFIPLHQAVSQLSVSSPSTNETRRPRSYSVGDPRNHYLIQPLPCKPVY